MTRPFAQACENNQAPIFEVLQHAFADRQHVLEIGSGTGQHSVYLAPRLPHVIWQTSELPALHAGIAAWHADFPAPNLRLPLDMDLRCSDWPHTDDGVFDAVFTSNTLHIVAWPLVQRLFTLLGQHLPAGGVFAVYGPFNYSGTFTSESNRAFDAWLKERDADSGIRDFEDVVALAAQHGLHLLQDHAMPANNRILVFEKASLSA
jgi:cyclopropane fatty-acyl-phospholipid synthase-like methyltransferase